MATPSEMLMPTSLPHDCLSMSFSLPSCMVLLAECIDNTAGGRSGAGTFHGMRDGRAALTTPERALAEPFWGCVWRHVITLAAT